MNHRLTKGVFFLGLIAISFTMLSTDRFWAISKNMQLFADVYRLVNDEHVEETDPNLLMRIALDTMLSTLDPYTNFFSEADVGEVRRGMNGSWDGVGIEIMKHKKNIVISELLEGFPGARAGVRVGDILLEIDGTSPTGKKIKDVAATLHVKAGTPLKLKLKRPSTGKEKEYDFIAQRVVRENVPYYGMLDEHTGYIILTTFTEKAGKNVADAFRTLQEDYDMKQVILDLRGNGGGLLKEAVELCNVFVNRGEKIVYTRNRVAEWDMPFRTNNDVVDTKLPLIVLINGRSASASEIVGGAIQDLDRGLLVGRNSFGKGLVQNTMDVGYSSMLKLTTSRYYIPSGRCVQALQYINGVPIEVPDSLRGAFKTKKSQRIVYDGRGLEPDYKVKGPRESAVAKKLKSKHLIFDFATKYHLEHELIILAKEFRLEDPDFENFVAFVENQNYQYETGIERAIEDIRRTAALEDYNLDVSIDLLDQKMVEIKAKEIYEYKPEIVRMLEKEIVRRYYFERGEIEVGLKDDRDINEAIKLFADQKRFDNLISEK